MQRVRFVLEKAVDLGRRKNTKQYAGTTTSWNIIKICPVPITTVSPRSVGASARHYGGRGKRWSLHDFFMSLSTDVFVGSSAEKPIPINTASTELRGAQPDVCELRLVPIAHLGLG